MTFEFERDGVSVRLVVFMPEVLLEAKSTVELAFARHPDGGVGISLKNTAVILQRFNLCMAPARNIRRIKPCSADDRTSRGCSCKREQRNYSVKIIGST